MTMVDLISEDNICGGIVCMDETDEIYEIRAPYVVLACGGLGGLYKNSTNFPHITGDALAIAMNHQVKLEHLDYIQIHPTTLYSKKPGRRFLISESVRGEELFFMTGTDSVLQTSCSREIFSVRRSFPRWKNRIQNMSWRICVLWERRRY